MRDLFLSAILFFSVPMIALYPHVGILVWSWISYFNPHRLSYGFMIDFPLLMVLGSLTIISWIVSKERKLPPNHPIVWALLLFFVWTLVTTAFSQNIDLSLAKLDFFWKIILFTILTTVLIERRYRIEHLMLIICLSLGYFSVKGAFGTIVSAGKYSYEGPVGTYLQDRNDLALAMVMMLPMLRYFQVHSEVALIRIASYAGFPIVLLAILGTQSRGGVVALAVAGLWLILKSKRRVISLVAIATVLVLGVSLVPANWSARIKGIETAADKDSSAQGRLQMWRYAMDLTVDHPVVGGGFKTFANRQFSSSYLPEGIPLRASHSVYFEALGEHGYVGLFLLLLTYTTTFITAMQTGKLCKNYPELKWADDMNTAFQAGILGFFVGGAFLELIVFDLSYHLCALIMMVNVLVKSHIATIKATITA